MKNKILMILSNPAINDNRPLKEATSLSQKGYNVTIYAWDKENGSKNKYVISSNLSIYTFNYKCEYGFNLKNYLGFFMFYIWCSLNFINNNYDYIHAHDIDTVPISYILTLINNHKNKFIYDMHDFPLIYLNNLPFSNKFMLFIYYFISKYVDQLIVVNDAFLNYFISLGIDPSKIVVIMNVPNLTSIQEHSEIDENKFTILYYGLLSIERGVQNLINAILNQNNIILKIAGNGELSQWIINKQKNSPNIEYLGFIQLKKLNPLIKSSDLIPILYVPHDLNQIFASPNKYFMSLSYGIPVIVPDKTYMSYLTKKYHCGLSINVQDVSEIQNSIKYLMENKSDYKLMGQNGMKMIREFYNWELMELRLLKIYSSFTSLIC